MDSDPSKFKTQRDEGTSVVTELRAAGFDEAVEIGRGGFGLVFRCTQAALDRVVAIKVLTADLDVNRERFLREQRAMGRLAPRRDIVRWFAQVRWHCLNIVTYREIARF
jgi:serine/threonine-protein kinase PknK